MARPEATQRVLMVIMDSQMAIMVVVVLPHAVPEHGLDVQEVTQSFGPLSV